jgi:hypothetical protein
MKKGDLMQLLMRYARMGQGRMRGQEVLADFIVFYLGSIRLPADEEDDFWRIEPHIPRLLLRAFDELQTSTDPEVQYYRTQYERATERRFPNLTKVGAADIVGRSLTVQAISSLVADVTNLEYLKFEIEKLFNAEYQLIELSFGRFMARVYCGGLFKAIDACPMRGMSGRFGDTELRSLVTAGRLMLTFARPGDTDEQSISFVGIDDDKQGLGAGLQSCYTNLDTALNMIGEVMEKWPSDSAEQAAMYVADTHIAPA